MVYSKLVGRRLRSVRLQKGLSLKEVEGKSRKRFKASVLGAYERGERSISVPRLFELASFYRVPVEYILAEEGRQKEVAPRVSQIRLDLKALAKLPRRERQPLNEYIELIRAQRGDFNDEMISIRRDDLRPLACLYHSTPTSFGQKLEDMGVLMH